MIAQRSVQVGNYCSEQLAPPVAFGREDSDDDIDDDWSTDATYIYLLLRNKLVVYVGIGYGPDWRVNSHYRTKNRNDEAGQKQKV